MTSAEEFDQAIDASHRALDEIARGNPDAFFALYSHRDDATLGTRTAHRPADEVRSRRRDGGPRPTTAMAKPSRSRASQEACPQSAVTPSRSSALRRSLREATSSLPSRCASRASFAWRTAAGSSCIATPTRLRPSAQGIRWSKP